MVFLVKILSYALILAVFSSLIGTLPLFYSSFLTKYRPHFINISKGIILSTIFIIIVPEGMEVLGDDVKNLGLYIVLGFVFVYITEEYIHLLTNGHGNKRNQGNLPETGSFSVSLQSYYQLFNVKSTFKLMLHNSVTFPLFIHGLTDGFTMGFITISENKKINTVILLSTIIHKIPALISLMMILMLQQQLPRLECLANLNWFALSTPIGFIFTSLFLKIFNIKNEKVLGMFLVASAGSLIYALIQTFMSDEEVVSVDSGFDIQTDFSINDYDEVDNSHDINTNAKVLCFIGGCSIPLVISFFIKE
ncbi:hypothetical protein ACO0OL_000124 [Hanseniaspora opuntiae]